MSQLLKSELTFFVFVGLYIFVFVIFLFHI